jgi:hypothetical protein
VQRAPRPAGSLLAVRSQSIAPRCNAELLSAGRARPHDEQRKHERKHKTRGDGSEDGAHGQGSAT